MKFKKMIYMLLLVVLILFTISKYNFIIDKLAGVVQNIRFKTITKNMKTKKLNNIMYYYLNKSDENYISNIEEYIKEGEVKTAPLFGKVSMYPFNIIMFTTSDAFGKVFNVNPKESQAVTNFNSLYIPCDNINSYVFVHEYTHYKMNSFCKEKGIPITKIPVWFQEGVAEYTSSTLFLAKFENIKIQKIQNFRKLDDSKQMMEAESNGEQSYMQSYVAVRKIIELKGQDSIQKILINTKFMSFYDAFKKVVGLSIEDFQKVPLTDSVDNLLKLAIKYGQDKNYVKQRDTYIQAIKKYPKNSYAWSGLGNSYTSLGDFKNAIKALKTLISIDKDESYSYFYYSQSLIASDLDKAISMAEKSVQLTKTDGSNETGFITNYLELLKKVKNDISSDKFQAYVTLIKSDYIYGNMTKINIINNVLVKYSDKSDKQKEQLIKLKSDLEKQK